MKKATFQALSLLLFLSACGNDPGQKTTNNPSSPENAAAAELPPATYLEGIYATSSTVGKGVENLFDTDPNTVWQTLPGTGPDEGIMLYFQNALPITSMEIVAAEGSFNKDLPDTEPPIQIYTNGQVANIGLPNEWINTTDNGLVKSLYIRFLSTGKEETETLQEGINRYAFPEDAFIAISEIKIVNDKGETLRLLPPQKLKGSVTASSTLAPEAAYSPANLFDSRKEFAWAEGAATAGEGEVLTFAFDNAVNITALQIWNGYQRSDEHFAANARVRDFEFGEKGGSTYTYTLRDTKAGQKIELKSPARGRSFELKINAVYARMKYKDLAISDIVCYDGERPFVLQSTLPEKYQSTLRTKAASSPIAALLNKRISNYITEDVTEGDVFSNANSLILRSDGTFVYYSESSSGGNLDISTIADGNWELLSDTQVKIFGKWTDQVNWPEYYQGNTQKTPTRIFNDVLTVNAKQLVGTKMVGTFFLK
ncbi:MAG: NADase-type glycan-binding domain-containing protein [Saprospiraceae bacterium]